MAGMHAVDYVVFGGMLFISLAIGVYQSLTGGRQRTNDEYLLGNRQMKVIPVTLSFTVSFISTILVLGFPAEIYSFGAGTVIGSIGIILGILLAFVFFVPVFYPLQYTSINEYLEARYQSKIVRGMGTFFVISAAILYSANVYFGPSTAIEAVTGFPAWLSILLCSSISVIYTTIGGYKAVIWTDVFQSVIMVVGMLAIVVKGVIAVGDFGKVWQINRDWGRLDFFDFDFDPRKRVTFWGCIFGRAGLFMGIAGCWQASFQRYSSMAKQSDASKVVFFSWPGITFLSLLAYLLGWATFAYFIGKGCDPVAGGILDNANQLVPHFVMELFDIPGFPGLFFAAATAAALSSASSALNASAGSMWQDILRHVLPPVSDYVAATVTKATVFVFGCLASALAFTFIGLGGTVVQVMGTFGPCVDGPNLSLYLLGILCPWVTWKGVTIGCALGVSFSLWTSFGSYSIKKQLDVMPTTTENCTLLHNDTFFLNASTVTSSSTTIAQYVNTNTLDDVMPWTHHIYSISFYNLMPIVIVIVMTTSILFSFLLGANDYRDVEPKYLHPWIRKILKHGDKEEDENKFEKIPTTIDEDELVCVVDVLLEKGKLENDYEAGFTKSTAL